MAYFMTIPVAIDMMGRINKWMGVEALFWKPADYIGFVLKLMVAFGLAGAVGRHHDDDVSHYREASVVTNAWSSLSTISPM